MVRPLLLSFMVHGLVPKKLLPTRTWRLSLNLWVMVFFLCSCLISLSSAHDSWAREIIDSTQTKVLLEDHPKRIITLIPSLGELAAEALDGNLEKIVAVSSRSDIPVGLAQKPIVGTYNRINIEAVLQYKPDLILASNDGNPQLQLKRLRELGQPLVLVNTGTLKQIEDSIRLVYAACGSTEIGQVQAQKFKNGLEQFRVRARGRKSATVLMEVAESPLVVAGRGSFLSDILELLGMRNIYADSTFAYPRPTLEDVIVKDPDFILILASNTSEVDRDKMSGLWKKFPRLKAVKNNNIKILKDQALVRPTAHLLQGIHNLEKEVYGER